MLHYSNHHAVGHHAIMNEAEVWSGAQQQIGGGALGSVGSEHCQGGWQGSWEGMSNHAVSILVALWDRRERVELI